MAHNGYAGIGVMEEEPSLTIQGAGTIPEFFQISLQQWNEKRQARGEVALQIRFVS